MRNLAITLMLSLSLCLAAALPAEAKIFQTVDKSYTAPISPLDMAVSADGNVTYLLGANGKIVIYNKAGDKEEIQVKGDFDHIQVSAVGDKIWLSSQKTKEIKEIFIDALKQFNNEGAPFLGQEKAPVVITSFSDFQCPHCALLGEVFQKLLEKNPTTLKVVYKYYPLPSHQFAGAAAVAAHAAFKQGKFWQFHDLVYAEFRDLTMEKLAGYAEKLKLNMPQFQQQMNSQEAKDQVIANLQEGRDAGVTGTPAVFVNGRLAHERTVEALQKMIDEALKK